MEALVWATWHEIEREGTAGFKWGQSVINEHEFLLEAKKFPTSAVKAAGDTYRVQGGGSYCVTIIAVP